MDLTKVSFSFIPSLKCNNKCSFCMYGASPDNTLALNYEMVEWWMKTVDWDKVVGWGFYGGEPSIEMGLYQRFFELVPEDVPKFVITNGTWSTDYEKTTKFLKWCAGKFHIIVSGTLEHRAKQDVGFVHALVKTFKGAITYKDKDEEMHPMGRLAQENWACTKKCLWHEQPIRLGIFPTGHIILQNCDGVYPIVGHIGKDTFDDAFVKGQVVREQGCLPNCPNINDLIKEDKMGRICVRCGCPFEPPSPRDLETNICGSCADDLRAEEDAMIAQAEAGAEAKAQAEAEHREKEEREIEEGQRMMQGGYNGE